MWKVRTLRRRRRFRGCIAISIKVTSGTRNKDRLTALLQRENLVAEFRLDIWVVAGPRRGIVARIKDGGCVICGHFLHGNRGFAALVDDGEICVFGHHGTHVKVRLQDLRRNISVVYSLICLFMNRRHTFHFLLFFSFFVFSFFYLIFLFFLLKIFFFSFFFYLLFLFYIILNFLKLFFFKFILLYNFLFKSFFKFLIFKFFFWI